MGTEKLRETWGKHTTEENKHVGQGFALQGVGWVRLMRGSRVKSGLGMGLQKASDARKEEKHLWLNPTGGTPDWGPAVGACGASSHMKPAQLCPATATGTMVGPRGGRRSHFRSSHRPPLLQFCHRVREGASAGGRPSFLKEDWSLQNLLPKLLTLKARRAAVPELGMELRCCSSAPACEVGGVTG